MNKNEYFGDNPSLRKTIRNATVKTAENCCLGYVNIELYSLNYYLGKQNFYSYKETLPTEENKTKKISIMMENSSSSWDSTNYNGEDFLNLIEILNKEKILNLKVSIYEYIDLPDSNGDYDNGDTLYIYLEK